jgi:hypothetical protein
MDFHLQTPLELPFEREHEGWAIRGIEDYAAAAGLRVRVCAVSPKREKQWPADEALTFRSKFFGLQFKRPEFKSGQLVWEIKPASLQYARICAAPEIFYALPMFTNRDLRRVALDHCVFWRPCQVCSRRGAVCYLPARRWQTMEGLKGCECIGPMRWGDFVEALYRCELVVAYDAGASFGSVAQGILDAFLEGDAREEPELQASGRPEPLEGGDDPAAEGEGEGEGAEVLHLLAMEMPQP